MSWLKDYASDVHRGTMGMFDNAADSSEDRSRQRRASHLMAFAVGPNAGAYGYGRSRGMNVSEASINALAPGITTESAQKRQKARMEEERAKKQRKQEEERQRKMRSDISGLRASYGMGTTPEAQSAAARLRAWQEQVARSAAGQATSAAGQGYQQALAQLRARLAQSGQLGGSLSAQQQNALMQQYAQQIAGAQQTGQQSAEALRQQLMRQRLGLESQIRGGAIDPNALAEARNQLWMYQNQPSAAEIAAGRTAAQGAAMYGQRREREARGV